MRIAEKAEMGLIAMAGAAVWLTNGVLPEEIELGRLFLAVSALLLLQGLVRDLWLLASAGRRASGETRKASRCLCVESTLGITGVVIGAAVASIGLGRGVAMAHGAWVGVVVLTLVVGFLIKDLVLEWQPWRVRRDADHMNIIVTWRRGDRA